MFKTLKDAWKVPEIRKRVYFTFLMIVIYRLGNNIPIPFIDTQALTKAYEGMQGTLVDMLNLLTGGGLASLSIFALGVQPYITSQIVMQLLTVAIPRLEELTKEGEQGRKTIQRYTRYLAVALAIFQSVAITNGLFATALSKATSFENFIMNVVLIAGTMFLTWIGDMITDKGIGNGVSLIIFFGIISAIPNTLKKRSTSLHYSLVPIWAVILMVAIIILIIIAVVILTQGERRIPVQYAKRVVGRKMYGGKSTNIPVKVNMSGVMPIIFASAVLAIPSTIALFIGGSSSNFTSKLLSQSGTFGTAIYLIVQSLLIMLFAYFYNQIQFNTVEYAKQLQQYGGFVPGIRPGKPTSEFLQRISSKITFIGALGLAVLTAVPTIASRLLGLDLSFGGSSVIIIVGVILETIKQIEAMITMKQYKGFLK
ncbi:MAG: preprotein translocase subunit SecY [Peptoniphilaceae bacterium]|nr:preprotein translocase subunit SecY [Peptoniphilaceae bacterium]